MFNVHCSMFAIKSPILCRQASTRYNSIMKKNLFTFLILFFSLLPLHAVKKIEANPINVAAMLTQETDTAKIASTCDYYGYIRQHPIDGYTVFKHPNGSVIRYKYTDPDQKYQTIEVVSKASQREKENTLQSLSFQKIGNAYERRSISFTTRCTSGPHNSLIFQQLPKPKKQ